MNPHSKLRHIAREAVKASILRRKRHWKKERADYLLSMGWKPIPFTPIGARDSFIAPITHQHQKWTKDGIELTPRITEAALKIEAISRVDELAKCLGVKETDFQSTE